MSDTGLDCFLILVQTYGKTVSHEQAKHLIALEPRQKVDLIELVCLARSIGLKAKSKRIDPSKFHHSAGAFIAKDRNDEFFIIAKYLRDSVIVLRPGDKAPTQLSINELAELWGGECVVITDSSNEAGVNRFGFSWFLPTILKYKRFLLLILLSVFIIQLLGLLTPLMMQVVIDKVLAHGSIDTLNVIAIGIALVYIYELLLNLGKNYLFSHTTNRIDVLLSYKLFKHLFSLPLKYFESRRVGETMARVRELDSIRNFLTGTPMTSAIDAIFIVIYIVVLFLYSVPLTLIVVGSIPVYMLLSAVITPLFKKRLEEKFEAGAKSQSFLVESVNGVQTVKAFALEKKFEKRWGETQADYVRASYRTSMVALTSSSLGEFVQKIFDLIVLFFGAKGVIDGWLTIGQLVAFRMLSGRVSTPVLRLVQLWQEYQQASLSVKRIGDIFNTPVEPAVNGKTASLPKLFGNIKLDEVQFRYDPSGPQIIKGISLDIDAGNVVGIVGRSGSGKSTISKLLQRFYIPEAGRITIDGIDLATVNPIDLRLQIGVVLQENFMFSGTIAENIAIHSPSSDITRIMEVARIAGAHDFITRLPNGYETMLGENGTGLSGGQKQRIAIARALINNPPILVLDEATSALDYESESVIQANMKEICKDRTVLIIAHRLSTVANSDRILVIDDGILAEQGSPGELVNSGGIYSQMIKAQTQNC